MVRQLVLIGMVLLPASFAHAAVRATLPLLGYHRPGMCIPVKVEGVAPEKIVEITGRGAIPTRVAVSGVAPLLIARPVEELVVDGAHVEGTFRAVPEGVRLVGVASDEPRAADPAAITVSLDPLDPVPGPAIAWEALDELVIDAAAAQRIGDAKLLELLALGVAIVVPGDARPAGSLPWRRESDTCALRHRLHGPRGSLFGPAMLPVSGWQPGVPHARRRQMFLIATMFAIFATGVALWRTKHPVLATGGLVAVMVAGVHLWTSRQGGALSTGGRVIVEGEPFTQVDSWTYYAATEPTTIDLPLGARVIAESPDELVKLQPALSRCRLPRGGRVALLSRSLSMTNPSYTADPTITSPLAPLARRGYVRAGVTIVAQVTEQPWPAVILRCAER